MACGGPSKSTSKVGPEWVVDSVPVTDIAGTTGDTNVVFESVVRAIRLSDGQVVIGDGYASTVRYFDVAGRQVAAYGRPGEGPGELGVIKWVGRCAGDSVFVWDTQSRMTVLSRDATLVRQFRVPADTIGGPQPVFFACGPGARLAFLAPIPSAMVMDPRSSEYSMGVIGLMDRVGHIEGLLDTVRAAQARPFWRITQLTLSADRFYVGTEYAPLVKSYALGGTSRDSVTVGISGRSVSDREYDAAIAREAAVFSDRSTRETNVKLMHRVPKPETLAPYFALFAVGHDTLWAQVSAPGDSVTVLDAVGPDGSPVGEARIAQDLTVMDMGRDYILGLYQTAEGDQHVAVYRLRPPHD